jgi:hypothetical protein
VDIISNRGFLGGAEAKAIEQKISSMDAGNCVVVQVGEALAKGAID